MLFDDNLREDQNIMEENDNDILVNDGINNLIHDTFAPMDEDALVDDDVRIHDNPLIDLSNKPLYEGSKTSLLSTIFLLLT
jgi:hypothetical protein